LLFSFQGPSGGPRWPRRIFERAQWRVGTRAGGEAPEPEGLGAYSSVGLERTPDKREVGGSNPPRPTSSGDELDGAVAQLVERQLCKLDVVGSTPISSTRKEAGPRVPRPRQ
jgi:hypothetical protein